MNLVSIIIPTFNNIEELNRAIKSILKQTYSFYEVIIVDDGSAASYEEIEKFIQTKSNFYYYKKDNEGPGLARQFGLQKAKGKYIQYLDSDDELFPKKLEIQVKILDSNPDLVMTYSLSCINNNFNHIHRKKHEKLIIDDLLASTLQVRKWHTSSCLWNYNTKNIIWNNLKNGEDVLHDFNVALKFGRNIFFHNEILTNVNFDGSDKHLSNANFNKKNYSQIKENILKLNLEIYKILINENLLINPLNEYIAERMFHSSIKLYIMGFRSEGNILLNYSKICSKSKIKHTEIFIVNIIKFFPDKYLRFFFQKFYLLHRKINKPLIHQYRFV